MTLFTLAKEMNSCIEDIQGFFFFVFQAAGSVQWAAVPLIQSVYYRPPEQ
jgi:hypothetical protein